MNSSARETQARRCILAALECAEACRHAHSDFAPRGGAPAEAQFAAELLECADLATTAARLLARGSQRCSTVWAVCTESALACAGNCLRRGAENETLLECAAACQRCAQRWQEFLAQEIMSNATATAPQVASSESSVAAPDASAA